MSSSKLGADYQVFLSFRGPDTRQGFTDCLYHFLVDAGVRVFRDNEEIRPGAKIQEILGAIDNSIVCIPIFSKDYASSKWCLRELAEMVEKSKKIMPIFYDVTPDDVKLKTHVYRDSLAKHEKEAKKEHWEKALMEVVEMIGQESLKAKEDKALTEVVKIKGWEVKDTGHGELCKSIVREVLANLKVKDRILTDHLVAMDERVEDMMKHLDVHADDVRYVGIHGIGGCGKTTLAKIIFTQLSSSFEACSFLANVRESSARGLEYLQKKLLCNLQARHPSDILDVDDGIKTLTDICKNKKVLIVLDDVDKREQIESLAGSYSWFSSGSRIIVTTRDIRVLVKNEADQLDEETPDQAKVLSLELKSMNPGQALQLFSSHAFNMTYPPAEYLDLSKEFVSVTASLPLNLEVIGSHLRGKRKEVWADELRKFARIPHKNIQKQLMRSYKALDIRTQQIFLDIACLPTYNMRKANAIHMWRSCGFHPEEGIKDLISLSLVKLEDNAKLQMHDHLSNLGKEIVLLENFKDFRKRSHVWNHEEAVGILMRQEGTEEIEVLHLSDDKNLQHYTLSPDNFKNLRNLRYLRLSGFHFEGNFEHQFSRLRWLCWNSCPSDFKATNLFLEKLAILDLSQSCVSETWGGWNQIRVGENLAVLDLSNCQFLSRMPDLSQYWTLERLILRDCHMLCEVDRSIGKLKRLKHLNLSGCCSLQGLPGEVGSLEALEELLMEGSHQSFTLLPESIGNLKSLLILEIADSHICQLPKSVVQLRKVKRLSLKRSHRLRGLPDTIGDMNSLVELDLSYTGITDLPNSIGDLKKLKQLSLMGCPGIRRLPDSLGELRSLVELDISSTQLIELPDSIGNLKELKFLYMDSCWVRKLPRSIGMMKKLEELHARDSSLEGDIPTEIGMLSGLRTLELSYTKICSLPLTTSQLSSLQKLYLARCDAILELPMLPTSLTELRFSSSVPFGMVPNLSNLNNLRCMLLAIKLKENFSGNKRPSEQITSSQSGLPNPSRRMKQEWVTTVSRRISWIMDLHKLERVLLSIGNASSLPEGLDHLSELKALILGWPELRRIPQLPSNLVLLRFRCLKSNVKLPRLSNLKQLAYLSFQMCAIGEDGFQSLGVKELERLELLEVDEDFTDLDGLHLPANLKRLDVTGCMHVKILPDVSHLKNLKVLCIKDCEELMEIPGLAELDPLPKITIVSCEKLEIRMKKPELAA